MKDISGQQSLFSLQPNDLQSYLESRLPMILAGRGCPMYVLTWSALDIGSLRPICALEGSAHHTFANGSTLQQLPTPIQSDYTDKNLFPATLASIDRGGRLMVDGPASVVGRLRAYGNAIVPQVAAAFIQAFAEEP